MKGISVYLLDDESRNRLLEEFPPRWKTFVGHHVTVKFGASDKDELPSAGKYQVIGYSAIAERRIDGSGIEALVVSIKMPHQSREHIKREDGNTYHITWSHGPGYSPKDAKEMTALGFTKLDAPIDINLEPAFIPFNK